MEKIIISEDGAVELLSGVIVQARKDCRYSYMRILKILGHVPETRKEMFEEATEKKLDTNKINMMDKYYNVVDFVEEDPYGVFNAYDCTSKEIIKAWVTDVPEYDEKDKYNFDIRK